MTRPEYTDFLRSLDSVLGPRLVNLYHAVRNIPYGSTGERDPVMVIKNNLGSCSGKHVLLRDLLRAEGLEAQIITMLTHFNKVVPLHESQPEELQRMIRDETVSDYHHYVRARVGDVWVKLDATWHDALLPHGFPVNNHWRGQGDTRLAAPPIREYPNTEDLAGFKQQLIAGLLPEQRRRRARFFELLTAWVATL